MNTIRQIVQALRPQTALIAPIVAVSLTLAVLLAPMAQPSHAMRRTAPPGVSTHTAEIRSTDAITTYVYLPAISRNYCGEPIPGATYNTLAPANTPMPPGLAENHPDINLAIRGYELVNEYKGLLYNTGVGDSKAPQLYGLFSDNRTATFSNVYAVHRWDWSTNTRGAIYANPPVTLAGLATTPGETIHVPDSGYDIGGGNDVMVLYASATRLTLKYTREDDVIYGYTIHLENVCVDPALLALYQSLDASGRAALPALPGGQALGRASGTEIGVVIRDTGSFMDPRSANSWWIGR